MKILLISQYFYPETFRGNDIAFHLAEKGHSVHVVAGIPNYPDGKFYDGYGLFRKRREVINGVTVTRIPVVPRGVDSKLLLVLNYFSYMINAWIYVLFHSIRNKYDRVFVQQLSPVMMSVPGILYKKLRKTPLYTWVLDLWPESLSAAGGITNKTVLTYFAHFSKKEYRWSDKILISSRSFTDSILKYGDYQNKIIYFPQWADGQDASGNSSISIPTLPPGFKIMFTGAVGEAHGFECTMQAALLTRENKDIKWIIVGDGRKLEWVKEFVRDNELEDTVLTLGRYPSETMPQFYAQADVLLASLSDDPLFSLYAPAKISSYMSSGKPILAVMNGEGSDVIRQADCGWTVPAGDSKGLADMVVKLSQTDGCVFKQKGANGLAFYNEHFVKSECLRKLDSIMGLNI